MTKSKPVAPKPVRAWTLVDAEGTIHLGYCNTDRRKWLDQLAKMNWDPPRRVIRVEIRPAPKRKGAKP